MNAVSLESDRERIAIGKIAARVQQLIGVQLHDAKQDMVRSRLLRRLPVLGVSTFEEYVAKLDADPSGRELSIIIDLLTTHKTAFFRESRHFELLSTRLAARRAAEGEALVWSAACSTGEEAYTISMACRGSAQLGRPGPRILATDVSRDSTEFARRGIYDATLVASVPERHRALAFRALGGGEVEVKPAIRTNVDFARLNLFDPWPMQGRFDFIFCRNVMIYFDRDQRSSLVGRFRERLVEGGLLFVGMTETLNGIERGLRYLEPGVYER